MFILIFFSQVFLFGDLNYRVLGLEAVQHSVHISRKDYQALMEYDEVFYIVIVLFKLIQ